MKTKRNLFLLIFALLYTYHSLSHARFQILGAESQANTTTGVLENSKTAMLYNSTFVVAWNEKPTITNGVKQSSIRLQRFFFPYGKRGQEMILDSGDVKLDDIQTTNEGEIFIVASKVVNGRSEIYLYHLDQLGKTLNPPLKVSDQATGNQTNGKIAIAADSRQMFVIYESIDLNRNKTIRVKSYLRASPRRIVMPSSIVARTNNINGIAISFSHNTHAVVAYSESSNGGDGRIKAVTLNWQGKVESGPKVVSPNGNSILPSIVGSSDNETVMVTWLVKSENNSSSIYTRILRTTLDLGSLWKVRGSLPSLVKPLLVSKNDNGFTIAFMNPVIKNPGTINETVEYKLKGKDYLINGVPTGPFYDIMTKLSPSFVPESIVGRRLDYVMTWQGKNADAAKSGIIAQTFRAPAEPDLAAVSISNDVSLQLTGGSFFKYYKITAAPGTFANGTLNFRKGLLSKGLPVVYIQNDTYPTLKSYSFQLDINKTRGFQLAPGKTIYVGVHGMGSPYSNFFLDTIYRSF